MQPYCELRNCTPALKPKRLRLGVGTRLDLRFGFVFERALGLLKLVVVVMFAVSS